MSDPAERKIGDGLLNREAAMKPSLEYESGEADDDAGSTETVDALLSKVEAFKVRGNIEFQKGRALAKHTAGKHLLSDACLLYAQGIKAMSTIDERLQKLCGDRIHDDTSLDDDSSTMSNERPGNSAKISPDLIGRADAARSSLFLNLAACNLLLGEWDAAIACCTQVLDRMGLDEGSAAGDGSGKADMEDTRGREVAAKAFYRRSSARVEKGELDAARGDIGRASELKPGDASIRRELKKVEKSIADKEAKEQLRCETDEGKARHRQQQLEQQKEQRNHQHDPESRTQPSTNLSATSTTTAASAAAISSGAAAAVPQTDGNPSRQVHSPDDEPPDQPERAVPGDGTAIVDEEEEKFPTGNGGECRDGLYAWSQSVREVQVSVKIPRWARSSDVRVDIRRLRLSIALLSPESSGDGNGTGNGTEGRNERQNPPQSSRQPIEELIILGGALSRPVQVDECLWTIEKPGRILVYLQKELPADGEPGYEWWAAVMDGDAEIDVTACDAGSDASKYPEHAKRRGARALWDYQQKSPDQRRKEEETKQRMELAKRQMEEEAEERQRDLDNALKNPQKAELYRQLRDAMPDTPISIK